MRYEFRIAGVVPDVLTATFPELDTAPSPENTRFFGIVTDEAHLYGLLIRFQSLGLRVVEMRELPG
jgi:hypothetical protein